MPSLRKLCGASMNSLTFSDILAYVIHCSNVRSGGEVMVARQTFAD